MPVTLALAKRLDAPFVHRGRALVSSVAARGRRSSRWWRSLIALFVTPSRLAGPCQGARRHLGRAAASTAPCAATSTACCRSTRSTTSSSCRGTARWTNGSRGEPWRRLKPGAYTEPLWRRPCRRRASAGDSLLLDAADILNVQYARRRAGPLAVNRGGPDPHRHRLLRPLRVPATSIDRIASRGVTKGALYYHFKDKEELCSRP